MNHLPTPVLVNGAAGRMGSATCAAIEASTDLVLVGKTGKGDSLTQVIQETQATVVVDFTTAAAGFDNAATILRAGAYPVIGTSGFTAAQVSALQALAAEHSLGGLIVPNFSIATILMMQFSEQAARYFNAVEIIEMHHDKKSDSPSGTALRTAEKIATVNSTLDTHISSHEIVPGARGARHEQVTIHAVRLPGLLAHQSVIFGGPGETLTLRSDCIDRLCYMPGVLLACRRVITLKTVVYGLEQVMG